MSRALVLRGDARHLPLPDASVDLIVTSPPYYALRSYTDGGQHYAGQIGSEATPAEYIAALLDCTREWVRVLKPSGSIWADLGDSYAGAAARATDYNGVTGRGVRRPGSPSQWTNANAAWLAAVLDCEGSVSGRIFMSTAGRESFVVWMRVGMMDREVIDRIYEITGVGRVFRDGRGVWNYHVASQAAAYVLARIWPWLRIKQRRALAALELCRHVAERAARGRRTLTSDDISYRAKLVSAIRDWNAHPARPNDYEPPIPARIWLPDHAEPTPAKSLRLLPERYRIAAVDELGLIARAVVIWSKPNGLPESVTDRVRRSHEDWVHLVKQPRYYAAVDAIREEYLAPDATRTRGKSMHAWVREYGSPSDQKNARDVMNPLGKLPGSVWEIATEPLTVPDHLGVDHFAAFPTEWPRRIILGWSPSGICIECGEGRRPMAERTPMVVRPSARRLATQATGNAQRTATGGTMLSPPTAYVTGEACACPDPTAPTRPSVILDPFGGTGTTALVACALGRHGITVDRSADYCRLAAWRTSDPREIAKAMRVERPEPVAEDQLAFDLEAVVADG